MKAGDLMEKALQAAASAKLLVEAGDADGACNRAYYAMFDAARAALLVLGHDIGKTHRGTLQVFSEQLVKSGRLSKDLGKLLKRAETFRYMADYESRSVDPSAARKLVEEAESFVAAIRAESKMEGSAPP